MAGVGIEYQVGNIGGGVINSPYWWMCNGCGQWVVTGCTHVCTGWPSQWSMISGSLTGVSIMPEVKVGTTKRTVKTIESLNPSQFRVTFDSGHTLMVPAADAKKWHVGDEWAKRWRPYDEPEVG